MSGGSGGGGGTGLGSQYYSLRWNNHPVNLVSVFTGLYQAESLVDVTLAAGGRHLQAHKVVLSACSEYFQSVFAANPCQHPVVILKDVAFDDLETVVKFMYHGIVNVSSDKLPAVLNTADALQIKGLEKTNELMAPYLASSSSSRSSQNLLSVPGQNRQPSTESMPEYLQRSRSDAGYYPHRAHSAESRGLSFESRLEVSRPKRVLTPPLSPSHSHEHITSGNFARKKFRNRSENTSSSFSTSVEQSREESPTPGPKLEVSPASGLASSPSRPLTSDSGSYHSLDTEHIAKKKRAMFQANKGSSSYGSKSSDNVQNSNEPVREVKVRSIQSLSSSSQSHSHSSDREEAAEAGSGSAAGSAGGLSVPRSMVRSASAEDITTPKFKRKSFLKRQPCRQESMEETEANPSPNHPTASAPPPPTEAAPTSPPTTASVPTSGSHKLVKQLSHPLLPAQPQSGDRQMKEEPLQETEDREPPSVSGGSATPARQPSLDPLCGLDPHLLYSSSGPRLSPTNLLRPVLPTVRIIPDPESHSPGPADGPDHLHPHHHLLHHPPVSSHAHHLSPTTSGAQLYPGLQPPQHLHAEVTPYEHSSYHEKKPLHLHPRMDEAEIQISSNNNPVPTGGYPPYHRHHLDPCDSPVPGGGAPGAGFGRNSPVPGGGGLGGGFGRNQHNIAPQHRQYEPQRSNDVPKPSQSTFGHCPKARDGPALSCNYCWNTTDGSGRILRRKTKYHCPECQTNLCIVPCFQQYHEAMENENHELRS